MVDPSAIRGVGAALFDLDGTLVDSEVLTERAIAGLLPELGIDVSGRRRDPHRQPGQAVEHLLRRVDLLAHCAGYTSCQTYQRSKPDPQCHSVAARRLGVAPSATCSRTPIPAWGRPAPRGCGASS